MEVKSKKRSSFTINDKFKIIQDIENGRSQAHICANMKLSKSTVSNIWKNRHKIKNECNMNASKKKMRSSTYPDIEEMLFKWFQQGRANNIPISGPMLQLKAEEFGKLTGKDFKCSSGWLDRFKKKHNIVFGKYSEEAASVNNTIVQDWFSQIWPAIFNADKTGIFHKMTPGKTHRFKDEQCDDGKLSKDRITTMVGANSSGTEDDIPLSEWVKVNHFMDTNKFPFEYVNVDEETHTTQELPDPKIVTEIQDAGDNERHLHQEETDCEEDDAEEQTITSAQALEYTRQLRRYFQSNGANKKIYHHLNKLEISLQSDFLKKTNVQSSTTD